MSSTARTILTNALKDIRVYGAGETPTDDDLEDALYQLNNMLDSWSIERLSVYQITQDSGLTWAASAQSRTVGSGGNLNITRPSVITNLTFTVNGIDYPIRKMITRTEYDAIPIKTNTSSFPEYAFYDPAFPLGVLYVYPVPNAAVTVAIDSWKQLQSFATLDTAISLPPGYERAIQKNVAIEIAPQHGPAAAPSQELIRAAVSSKVNLKGVNMPSMVAAIDPAILGNTRPTNIYADG